jgi:hypothetical protein
VFEKASGRRDLNPRPLDPQSRILCLARSGGVGRGALHLRQRPDWVAAGRREPEHVGSPGWLPWLPEAGAGPPLTIDISGSIVARRRLHFPAPPRLRIAGRGPDRRRARRRRLGRGRRPIPTANDLLASTGDGWSWHSTTSGRPAICLGRAWIYREWICPARRT